MKIGFIGLGAMGLPIVQRLVDLGVGEIHVYDASPGRVALLAAERPGVGVAESADDAARGADVVVTVLPADRHVEQVVSGMLDGGARFGQLIELSTIAPSTIERVASRLGAAGVGTVSVALTRGTKAAREGTLGLFVGAEARLPDEAEVVLRSISSTRENVAGRGAAKAIKIANNMVMGVINVAIDESLVIGEVYGIAAEQVADAIEAAGADSWVLRNQIRHHLFQRDLGPGYFSTVNMLKDMLLHLTVAADAGVPAWLAGVCAAHYRGVIALGHGQDYHPIVHDWIRAGAAGGQRTLAPPDGMPATLAAGVRAAQWLADHEALLLLGRHELEPDAVVAHLAGATGANATMPFVVDAIRGGRAGSAAATLCTDLEAFLACADSAAVPAQLAQVALGAARDLAGEVGHGS